jgi:hypothetical protein
MPRLLVKGQLLNGLPADPFGPLSRAAVQLKPCRTCRFLGGRLHLAASYTSKRQSANERALAEGGWPFTLTAHDLFVTRQSAGTYDLREPGMVGVAPELAAGLHPLTETASPGATIATIDQS